MTSRTRRGPTTTPATRETTRPIHLAIDVASDGSGSWRLVAECDDELTQMVVMNGKTVGLTRPEPSELRGELGRTLVADHMGRCGACQAWAAARARSLPAIAAGGTP
jgi:hypothetical protein